MEFVLVMCLMSRFIVVCLISLFTTLSWAQAPMVISIHPIYLIAKEITHGVEQPKLLLENQTGHDVQLTPAHRKMIQDASLMIWLGKSHEAPLVNVLSNNPNAISLLDTNIIHTLPLRNSRGVALKNTIDTHVWLDPNNAVRIGFFIAALRSQQYPEYKNQYWANAQRFAKEMLHVSQQYKNMGVAKPYWAFHDAYQYLERPLNLKFVGSLTEDSHIAPTIAQIKYLNDSRPQRTMCLLAESSANPNQYKKLGNVQFEMVNEAFNNQQNFVSAWQYLAAKTQDCVKLAQK